jgi:uncharacterized protein (DUF924 family)
MNVSRVNEILEYWIPISGKGDFDKWFLKGSDYDDEITNKFGSLLKKTKKRNGFDWLATKDSFVAYIILMDQFSRHIYRGSKKAFETDNTTMIFTKLGFELYMSQFVGYEFMFAFMPYMHTESLHYQMEGKSIFSKYIKSYNMMTLPGHNNLFEDEDKKMFQTMSHHLSEHRTTVEKYTRFPKRNRVLGRKSTEEEEIYILSKIVQKRSY